MTAIHTLEDWRKLAASTLPQLGEYASWHSVKWDEDEAKALFEAHDNKTLAIRLERLWELLPDKPVIRYAPFFDLCDLCSETWVLYEGGDDDRDHTGGFEP